MSIPKKLHYCWFGGNKKPDLILKCIESWRNFMPEFEIIEWNETNFDVNCCPYVKKAYETKKWAYVTDVARLKVIEQCGGIYIDADVQIIKPLDRFLQYRAFTGSETNELTLAAVMGSEPGHPWIQYIMRYYENAVFDPYRLIPNTRIVTALSRPFIERQNYGFTYLKDGVVIFPITYFAGYDHQQFKPIVTEDTYSIHHFAGTWLAGTLYERDISKIKLI